jgi:predicted transcriptional regulator
MSSGESSSQLRNVLENRADVLRYLVETPSTKPELVTALSAARSTIDRAVRDLEAVDCLTKRDGQYHATPTGQVALTEYDRYVAATDSMKHTSTFINSLPEDAPLDVALLHDADFFLAESHAPEAALAGSIDVFERATVLRGLAPVVLAFYPRLIADRVASGDLTVEIVAQENVVDSLSDLPTESVDRFVANDAVTIYATEEQLPYALWLMETPEGTDAGITAYEEGGVRGVLMNDSDTAVTWAKAQYDQYRERAQLVAEFD